MKIKQSFIFLLMGPAILFSSCQKSKKPGVHMVMQTVFSEAGVENAATRDQVVRQVMIALKERMSEAGVEDAVILRIGAGDRLLVQIPEPKDIERIKILMHAGGRLEMRKVEAGPCESGEEALQEFNGILPADLEIVRTDPSRMGKGYYALQKSALVSNSDIKTASTASDEYGAPAVGFKLTGPGGEKFKSFTSADIGKRLAIVLDNRILSVATIQDAIGSEGIIKGRFTQEEVENLVLMLRSPLPLSIRFLEERTVFPVIGSSRFSGGGSLIEVGFHNPTTVEELQHALKKTNLKISDIQQIAKGNKFFIMIRDSSGERPLAAIVSALMSGEELEKKNSGKLDLNNSPEIEIADFLSKKGMAESDARAMARDIMEMRKRERSGVLSSGDFSADGEKRIILQNHTFFAHFTILDSQKIWPSE